MLYKQEAIPVYAEGFKETTNFDIPATGKAFKSLIDNIYSRKIEAPIRELCTNAYDAHLEIGLNEPFRMKLPTQFDPLFMVRDYGIGMTHEFIMGDFKSLFKSTKDQTNKVVGMKGLGSKSPFAYTDAFILRVFNGETVRTYSTYIAEDGIPQLAYQGEAASSERQGVAVQFPVQTKDFADFMESAIRVLKGFPVLPEGLPKTVLDELTGKDAEVLESGTFWKCFNSNYLGKGAFAKQGCVIYPIDLDKITDGEWISKLNLSILIEFPIGSVQMVDSREFLAYDEETIANINTACNNIHDEIDVRIKATLATAKTPWEIRSLFRNYMFSNLGPLARSSKLYANIDNLNSYIKAGLFYDRRERERNYNKFPFFSVVSLVDGAPKAAYSRRDYHYSDTDMNEPVFVFVGKDMKLRRGMNQRAGLYLEQNPKVTCVVMLERLPLKVHRALGKPKIMRITDLPEKPKAAYDRAPVVWNRFKTINSHGDVVVLSEEKLEEVQEKGVNIVYLFRNKNDNFLDEDTYFGTHELAASQHVLRSYLNTVIVLINVRANEKLSRWSEAEFPRYDPNLKAGFIQRMTRPQIIPLINQINKERFDYSYYSQALSELGSFAADAYRSGRRNPLIDLMRFNRRVDKMSSTDKKKANRLGSEYVGQIVDRALELGLEVLPEQIPNYDWNARKCFPYPLLRGKWERMAIALSTRNDEERTAALYTLMTQGGK